MIYHGKLYGKSGRKYVPLLITTDDVNAQSAILADLRAALRKARASLHDFRELLTDTTQERMKDKVATALGEIEWALQR